MVVKAQTYIEEIEVTINKRMPEKVPCPRCRKTMLTTVVRERSTTQIVISVLLCLGILILWPCALMVWRDQNMMDYHHVCSNCYMRITTFNPRKSNKKAQ